MTNMHATTLCLIGVYFLLFNNDGASKYLFHCLILGIFITLHLMYKLNLPEMSLK